MQCPAFLAALGLAALAAGCEDAGPAVWAPRPLFHDFGMIPHSKVASVRLPIDFPTDRGPILPIAFQGDCSCASWAFVVADPAGKERVIRGRSERSDCVVAGERLFLELRLDTNRKEALEQKPVTTHGQVVMVDFAQQHGRIALPVSFTFGIDAPVMLAPFAHVDFGGLPMSRIYTVSLELRGKEGTKVRFGPVQVDDPRVTATLTEQGPLTLLDVRVQPRVDRGFGAVAALVRVGTDLPDGYTVPIPVTGTIVDDVEVKPMERISFGRFDLRQPAEGFVILHDHDLDRDPEFVVLGLRGIVGNDLDRHFSAELQPIDGDPHGARLVVRYHGTYTAGVTFRGMVDVGKRGGSGSVASIEFVGFADG